MFQFFLFKDELYWGKHQRIPAHPDLFGMVYRTKPLVPHWHVTGKYGLRRVGNWAVIADLFKSRYILITPERFSTVDPTQAALRVVRDEGCGSITHLNNLNFFRNRYLEYRGHFMPMWKGLKGVP